MNATAEIQIETELPATESSNDRSRWIERYRKVRSFSESLCQPLETEDFVIQSMPDASPAKWHLAHTTWFFETFILRAGGQEVAEIHPQYAYLFNSYYNAVGPMHCRPRRGMISRPTVAETIAYRREVDQQMIELIANLGDNQWQELQPLIELGLHHEQQHQELLLTDLKHLFAQNPLYPVYSPDKSSSASASSSSSSTNRSVQWITFPEGIHWIGHDGPSFAFDNERPRHKELVQAFKLAQRLVTNEEYLAFIDDRGYERPELWLSLGWFTVTEQKWSAPLHWQRENGEWWNFTLSGFRPVALNEPVCHVSYFEADAFARWVGARLPTEAEWEAASANLAVTGNFVEAGHYHPICAAPRPSVNLEQMFGDAWEWTRSSYSPYPGYAPPPGAIGEYNGKFMCNQYVLRGGSCVTSQSHIRRTYRNFFAPEKRWQFTGIRLAKDIE